MWVSTKSKSYKAFVSFLVAIILVFSYENSKPKAIVPIVIWGAGILAGVVAEEMLEMGIKHVTANGKTGKKGKAGKIADEILDSLGGYDFDNTKPTRKADGSLEVNLSANDRAKIARKIADEFGDIVDQGLDREDDLPVKYMTSTSDNGDPLYNTGIWMEYEKTSNIANIKGNDIMKYYNLSFQPHAYEKQTTITWVSVIDGSSHTLKRYGNEFDELIGPNFKPYPSTTGLYNSSSLSSKYFTFSPTTLLAYDTLLKVIEINGSRVYFRDGLSVPSGIKNVYKVGEGYNGNLPNKSDLSNKPYKIPNFFPTSESDSDVEWELVQNHYDNDLTNNQTKIDNQYETYLENGDLNQNTYNTQTINNYYTDTNYPVKSGEIEIDIDIPIDNTVIVNPDDDDGNGTTVHNPHVEHVEELNQGMFAIMKNSYDYLGDSLDNALLAMKDVTDDATGIIVYLDTAFDWLPSEWRALFGSAFVLGIFAHFFRR